MNEQTDSKVEYQELLDKAAAIARKYDEIDRITGRNFNTFYAAGIERKEHAHSKFLANLLDPKGSHGQGNKFLQRFLSEIKDKCPHVKARSRHHSKGDKPKFEKVELNLSKDTTRDTEYDLGDYGRADILLKDGDDKGLLIENKIDAADQDGQIHRYCEYAKKEFEAKGVVLVVLYLNLDGEEPTSSEDKISGEDFYIISYREHIAPWLERCLGIVTDVPLREGIQQYLQLIQRLTDTEDKTMEIRELIKSNLVGAHEIYETYSTVKKELLDNFRSKVKAGLEKEKNNLGWDVWDTPKSNQLGFLVPIHPNQEGYDFRLILNNLEGTNEMGGHVFYGFTFGRPVKDDGNDVDFNHYWEPVKQEWQAGSRTDWFLWYKVTKYNFSDVNTLEDLRKKKTDDKNEMVKKLVECLVCCAKKYKESAEKNGIQFRKRD
ncbi:MAG: PD-(D/E)XK nuclease family protein [Pseudohongiellaceae bacterium]